MEGQPELVASLNRSRGHSLMRRTKLLPGMHISQIEIRNDFLWLFYDTDVACLQCFDAVGWAAGRASGL